ncbi:MAG TPA: LPS assembly protein LptD [Candidatus Sulfotelmatobacter sp.]|nr:LPS assembly protein LptD [Candidatus Sulfotelmatobacter sp.]
MLIRRLRRFTPSLMAIAIALGPVALAPLSAANADDAAPAQPHKKHHDNSGPAEITADQMQHDRDLNSVTARGHVEVNQNGRILLADTLSYNLKQDVIIATGNVSLTDLDGQVTFAEYMEITGDMKEAVAQGIRMVMIDDSHMEGKNARRIGGTRTIMNSATYSACRPCAEHPEDPPLWQLRAKTVTHDEIEHVVEYEDMWLDVAGIPVAYAPYFSHTDPMLKRKSGLLAPGVINNSSLGTAVRVPYFQVIDDYHDITLSPMVSTNRGEQLGVKDRWRLPGGDTQTSFSVANETGGGEGGKDTVGWHIDAKGEFDINDAWRTGYTVQRASDKDYLRIYDYRTSKPYLTTNPYLEGFGYRSYASVEAYSFQNLSTSASTAQYVTKLTKGEPLIGPLGTYSFVGEPTENGGYWTVDARTATITREHGTNSRRINSQTSWNLPAITSDGQVINFTTGMRVDAYDSDNVADMHSGSAQASRTIPSASLDWRYPLSKVGALGSQTLTPIVVTTVSPFGGNSIKIPNEDSLAFELDDVNIFSPNPYNGYDHVFAGPRVAYGGEYNIVSRGLPAMDVLMAQSYQVHPDRSFQPGGGLDEYLSDYVGRVGVSPSDNMKINYRFRIDKDDGVLRRSEIDGLLGPKPFQLSASYVFFDKLSESSPYNAREQLSTTLTTHISRYWATQFYSVENLGINAGPQNYGARLIYDDECLQTVLDAGNNHTTAVAANSGRFVVLRLNFKTVTQFPVDLF